MHTHTHTPAHAHTQTHTRAHTHTHTCTHAAPTMSTNNERKRMHTTLHEVPPTPSPCPIPLHRTQNAPHAPPQVPKKQKNPRPPRNQRTQKKQRTDLAKMSINPLYDTWSAVPIKMIDMNDKTKEHNPVWDPQSKTPPKLMHVPSHKIKTFMTRTKQGYTLDLSVHDHKATRPQFSQLQGVKALKHLASQTPPLASYEQGHVSTMNNIIEEKRMLCAQLHEKLTLKTPIKFTKQIDPVLHRALRMSYVHPPYLTHNGAKLQLSLPLLNPELPHITEFMNMPTMHVLWTDTGEHHVGQSTQPQTRIRTHLRCVRMYNKASPPSQQAC